MQAHLPRQLYLLRRQDDLACLVVQGRVGRPQLGGEVDAGHRPRLRRYRKVSTIVVDAEAARLDPLGGADNSQE